MRQNRLELGAEKQRVAVLIIEQRLDPDAVACEKEPFRRMLPHGKGEDAVELFHTCRAPADVGFEQHLRIRMPVEREACPPQLPAQLLRIVELAVVDDGIQPALMPAGHGLNPAGRVDDGKPCMDERRMLRQKHALLVGTAPYERVLHPLKDLLLCPQLLRK